MSPAILKPTVFKAAFTVAPVTRLLSLLPPIVPVPSLLVQLATLTSVAFCCNLYNCLPVTASVLFSVNAPSSMLVILLPPILMPSLFKVTLTSFPLTFFLSSILSRFLRFFANRTCVIVLSAVSCGLPFFSRLMMTPIFLSSLVVNLLSSDSPPCTPKAMIPFWLVLVPIPTQG